MNELVTTTAILILAMGCHIVIWRVKRPVHDVRGLLTVGGLATAGVLTAGGCGWWYWTPTTIAGLVQTVVAAFAPWLAYTEFYLAIKNESPSSRMLLDAARHPHGVFAERLLCVVSEAPAAGERLDSLIEGGLIKRVPGGLAITSAGRRLAETMAKVVQLYRLPVIDGPSERAR